MHSDRKSVRFWATYGMSKLAAESPEEFTEETILKSLSLALEDLSMNQIYTFQTLESIGIPSLEILSDILLGDNHPEIQVQAMGVIMRIYLAKKDEITKDMRENLKIVLAMHRFGTDVESKTKGAADEAYLRMFPLEQEQ